MRRRRVAAVVLDEPLHNHLLHRYVLADTGPPAGCGADVLPLSSWTSPFTTTCCTDTYLPILGHQQDAAPTCCRCRPGRAPSQPLAAPIRTCRYWATSRMRRRRVAAVVLDEPLHNHLLHRYVLA